jgi:hypothetical protein
MSLTLSVDSPIQALPLTFDLDIGFVHKAASKCGINFWTQR